VEGRFSFMELQAVLFDLWGTLIIDSEHRSAPRALWRAENVRSILAQHSVEFPAEAVHNSLTAGGAALSALHDEGIDLSARGRVHLVLKELEVTAVLAEEALQDLQTAICSMHPVHRPEVRPGAIEVLRASKERGLATALVSNAGYTTAPSLRVMLDEFGLAPYLDACVFSDELQLAKPNPRLFLEALDCLHVEPQAAAFVGDSPHNDIFGARRAGLLAVQIGHRETPARTGYTDNEGARANAYIDSLAELLPAIQALATIPRPTGLARSRDRL
jgi:HAD superfamily hydrolase (TIGR01509 family)